MITRDFLEETISPDEDAFKVLARLGSDDHRLAVVSGGVLAGIVSREDALRRDEDDVHDAQDSLRNRNLMATV